MPSSSKKKPLVIVTRKLPDAIETRLMELFDDATQPRRRAAHRAATGRGRQDADVLVPTVTDRIDAACCRRPGRG